MSKEYRRSGVGQLLMQRLVEVATETGCSRIEWTTDVDNSDAQQFYENLGYSPHRGELSIVRNSVDPAAAELRSRDSYFH